MAETLRLNFKYYEQDGLSRIGHLNTWKRRIMTPVIWFGLSVIENYNFQYEALTVNEVECFLCNAYDLLFQDKNGERKKLVRNLSEKIALKCDSGGFQTMTRNVKISVDQVYSLQCELGCDLAVQLDFPLNPLANKEANKKRIYQTLKNLERIIEINEKLSILPVIHGYDKDTLNFAIKGVIDILGEDPPAIGIGSLVPLLMTSKGAGKVGGKKKVIDTLIYLRQKLPDTFLHVFGAGGTMAYLIIFCGADSFDFTGWIQKAGHGVIQLPGISDRFISNRKKRKALNRKEMETFLECVCPACRSNKIADFKGRSERARLLRAIHNIYVYQTEIWRIRRFIREGCFREFVFSRLKNSVWKSLLKYADRQLVNLGVYSSKCEKIDNFIKDKNVEL